MPDTGDAARPCPQPRMWVIGSLTGRLRGFRRIEVITRIGRRQRWSDVSGVCNPPCRSADEVEYVGPERWRRVLLLCVLIVSTPSTNADGFRRLEVSNCSEVYRQLPLPPHDEPRRHDGMITSGRSVQAALGSADARLLARRSPPRPDFRQIAGMRANGPTPRKSRVRPAWISPAVRVPGGRQGAGSGEARNAGRVGVGQHLAERIARGQDRHPAHQHLARLLPGVLEPPAVLHSGEEWLDGLITNDKFCLVRTGRLALSWWRYPLRRRDQAPGAPQRCSRRRR